MRKLLFFTLVVLSFTMVSCSPSPVGTWVEKSENSESQGFTLNKDGSATSVNMRFVEFKSWEKLGDNLILKGSNVGSVKRDFSDTMKIEKISKTELVLSQAGYSVTYVKE